MDEKFGGKNPNLLLSSLIAIKINKGWEINSCLKLKRIFSKCNTSQSSHCATGESSEPQASGKCQEVLRDGFCQTRLGNVPQRPQRWHKAFVNKESVLLMTANHWL